MSVIESFQMLYESRTYCTSIAKLETMKKILYFTRQKPRIALFGIVAKGGSAGIDN